MTGRVADAAVIGAGVAGLTCARTLADAGVDVVVLEARARIGGRVHTLRIDGEAPLELGAHVVHGREPGTWELIEAAGLGVAAADAPAAFAIRVRGEMLTVPGLLARGATPPWELEQRLRRRPAEERSVADILAAEARDELEYEIASEWMSHRWGGPPGELSASGVQRVMNSRASEARSVLVDGFDRLPQALAAGLDVRLRTAVSRVAWGRGNVEISAGDLRAAARAVVVSIPPTVVASGTIAFDPALPVEKARAVEAIDLGDALVVVARCGPAPVTASLLDVGRFAGFWQSRQGSELVAGWFRGAAAGRVRAAGVDARLLGELLEPVFPWVEARTVRDVRVADWGADPFTLGAFSYPRAGILEMPAVWASPLAGTIFFAGEAACTSGNAGLVDGAVESGRRAGREVIDALDRARRTRVDAPR